MQFYGLWNEIIKRSCVRKTSNTEIAEGFTLSRLAFSTFLKTAYLNLMEIENSYKWKQKMMILRN